MRAPGARSYAKFESTREQKPCTVLGTKMKAHAVVGARENSLLGDPGSELHLMIGREKEMKKGQTTESGTPPPFLATVRYSRIHLGF